MKDEENTESDHELSSEEKTRIIEILLGPPEEWDEADSQFAMKIHGVDPNLSPQGLVDIVEGAVRKSRQRGEPVPRSLLKVLTKLRKKTKSAA